MMQRAASLRTLISAATFAFLGAVLLSGVHHIWWLSYTFDWFAPAAFVPARVLVYALSAAITGAVALLIQHLSLRSIGIGALAAVIAWVVGGVFLYGPTMLQSPILPSLTWWTTTYSRNGESGGSVYSGWFVIGGLVMGLAFGTLTSRQASTRLGVPKWWIVLAALAGALGWGLVPAGAWAS
jgi:hypothetical protein